MTRGDLRTASATRARPLRARGASGRGVRNLGVLLVVGWFLLPVAPLALWAFANDWAFPSALPSEWGWDGLIGSVRQGALPALGHSLALSLLVSAIATPLGAMAARALTFGAVPWPRAVGLALLAPIALPPFAAVMGLNVILLRAHVPPEMGLVLVLVVMAIPYTTFTMRVAYAAHDIRYEEEARTLGASRRNVLWRVHVPLVAPALARAAFLAFLVGWSDYVVTLIVGGGEVVTLPLVTASIAAGIGNDATVAVLSLSAIVPPLILLALAGRTGAGPRTDGRTAVRYQAFDYQADRDPGEQK